MHIAFLAFVVTQSHYPVLFVGAFMFFLGFVKATEPYQSVMDLKSPLLVGFFLAGLVTHGALQGWWIAPVLGPDGKPPASKRAADAEALARASDGSTWVFYEQDHRGERFAAVSACRPESLALAPDRRWTPPGTETWPGNGGMEAVAALGAELRVLAEAVPGDAGGRLGLAGVPDEPVARFSWQSPEGYQPTAMDPLEPGGPTILVLHRRFSPLEGASAILAAGEMGAGLSGEVRPQEIARFAAPLLVDNMEALAVRREGERRFVYLLSDDNFNALQRTLLLKFELLAEPAMVGGR